MKKTLFILLLLFLFLIPASSSYYIENKNEEIKRLEYIIEGYQDRLSEAYIEIDKLQRIEFFYAVNISEKGFVGGAYYHPYGFCVWTKDEDNNMIWDKIYHESCHLKVRNDPIHFCKIYIGGN